MCHLWPAVKNMATVAKPSGAVWPAIVPLVHCQRIETTGTWSHYPLLHLMPAAVHNQNSQLNFWSQLMRPKFHFRFVCFILSHLRMGLLLSTTVSFEWSNQLNNLGFSTLGWQLTSRQQDGKDFEHAWSSTETPIICVHCQRMSHSTTEQTKFQSVCLHH